MKLHFQRIGAVLLLALMFAISWGAALRQSPTVDEYEYIGAGLSYWQKLDLRMSAEHPPLSKLLAAVPLLIRGTRADYQSPSWTISESFIYSYTAEGNFGDAVVGRWNAWRTTLTWARFPMMLVTLWLGWMLYLYATRLGGPWGGLLCLAVYVGSPVFLAFGPLVLTDIPLTLFALMTLWQLGELWTCPSSRNTILLGLALAAAQLSKFSALILLAVIPLFFLIARTWPLGDAPKEKMERKAWARLRGMAILWSLLWAYVIVYAVYFVFSWNQPNSALDLIGSSPWADPLRRTLMPIWLYVRGIALMLHFSSRSTYLFGHTYAHGIPFYFPVVLVLKSPLGFLALLVMAVIASMVSKKEVIPTAFRPHWWALLVGFVIFTVTCLSSRINISIRHFSVPHVLLILMLAPLPRLLGQLRWPRVWHTLAALFTINCLATALITYPWFIPYINSLSLGRPAYMLLNGSNVDWNQGLPEVSEFMRRHQLRRVKIDWVSLSDPAVIVPQAEPWDCQAPTPEDAGQWAVVSATVILEVHACGWLQPYLREKIAGGSMYAVQLPERIPLPGEPGGPPLAAERRSLFGTPFDLRAFAIETERHPEKLKEELSAFMRKYYPNLS